MVVDEELTAQFPAKRASKVTIHTKSGSFSNQVDYPKGEPENPLSQQELEDKFRELAMYGGLTKEECDEVISEVWKEDFNIKKIISLCCSKK